MIDKEYRLRVSNLQKSYGSNRAVDDVSFDVVAGEIVCLAGPNGSGKTTSVEIIEGLRKPDSGRVEILGREYGHYDSRPDGLGVQLQEESLPARIKVSEAIGFYSKLNGLPGPPMDLAELLGLTDFWSSTYVTLSGGQKRRVVLALAVLANPQVVILDEPTSGLDPAAQETVVQLLEDLRRNGVATLTTLHDMGQAEKLSDDVVLLHEGRLVRQGSPAKLVAEFGATNRLSVPKSTDLAEQDLQHLGIIRSLELGEKKLMYGGPDLPGAVQRWDRFAELFSSGDRSFDLRPVGLVDVYLDLVGDKADQRILEEGVEL